MEDDNVMQTQQISIHLIKYMTKHRFLQVYFKKKLYDSEYGIIEHIITIE